MKLTRLVTIAEATPISQLTEEQLKELQTALSLLGYPVGEIDGLLGPKTRNAWAEFKTDVFQGNPDLIGLESIEKLQEKLDEIGEGRVHDFSTKQGTIEAIKQECKAQGIGLNTHIAYVLATVEWETAQTFKPVREAFWLSEDWRRKNLRYYPYYGRGYVQLTWKTNYAKYAQILGIDLVNNPDLALNGNTALFVLVHGFKTGTFTGRTITEFINVHQTDFVSARRCINGRDRAHDIAQLAEKYLKNL
jgi:peptidoglycan hydrolase-like protein with peptidoglycan-binding domain